MQDSLEYTKIAKSDLEEAEHLLTVIYKLTKDEKIFLSIFLKLASSIQNSIISYLDVPEETSFEELLRELKTVNDPKLGFTEQDYAFLTDILTYYNEHKKSPMEFARKEKFIIANNNYILHTLTFEKLDEFFQKTKKIVANLIMAS